MIDILLPDSLDDTQLGDLLEAFIQACCIYVDIPGNHTIEIANLATRTIDGDIAYGALTWRGEHIDTSTNHEWLIALWNGNEDIKPSDGELLICIAHEIIHLGQYARGDLRVIDNGDNLEVQWHGTIIDVTKIDYSARPWEIQAINNEQTLFEKAFVKCAPQLLNSIDDAISAVN